MISAASFSVSLRKQPADPALYAHTVSTDEKLALIVADAPGIYIFTSAETGVDYFDPLASRIIALAVHVKAWDLHVDPETCQVRVEIRRKSAHRHRR